MARINLRKRLIIGSLALAGTLFYSGYTAENNSNLIKFEDYITESPSTNAYMSLISANYFDLLKDSTSYEKTKAKYENYQKSELEKILKEEKARDDKILKDERNKIDLEMWKKGRWISQDSLNIYIKKAYKNVNVWPDEFDKRLFRVLIRHESNKFNVYAESPTGYMGLGQIGYSTYETFKPEKYESFKDPITGELDSLAIKRELFNPIINLELTFQNLDYVSNFCNKFHPTWSELTEEDKRKVILTCYNAGVGMVRDKAKWNIKSRKLKRENRRFADLVMADYNNPNIIINVN